VDAPAFATVELVLLATTRWPCANVELARLVAFLPLLAAVALPCDEAVVVRCILFLASCLAERSTPPVRLLRPSSVAAFPITLARTSGWTLSFCPVRAVSGVIVFVVAREVLFASLHFSLDLSARGVGRTIGRSWNYKYCWGRAKTGNKHARARLTGFVMPWLGCSCGVVVSCDSCCDATFLLPSSRTSAKRLSQLLSHDVNDSVKQRWIDGIDGEKQ
jgi:hypothetical protein